MAHEIVRFSVALHREELTELHVIAAENGLPVGTVIRFFVRHFLIERRNGRPWPNTLGAVQDSPFYAHQTVQLRDP